MTFTYLRTRQGRIRALRLRVLNGHCMASLLVGRMEASPELSLQHALTTMPEIVADPKGLLDKWRSACEAEGYTKEEIMP